MPKDEALQALGFILSPYTGKRDRRALTDNFNRLYDATRDLTIEEFAELQEAAQDGIRYLVETTPKKTIPGAKTGVVFKLVKTLYLDYAIRPPQRQEPRIRNLG